MLCFVGTRAREGVRRPNRKALHEKRHHDRGRERTTLGQTHQHFTLILIKPIKGLHQVSILLTHNPELPQQRPLSTMIMAAGVDESM